MGLFSLPKCPYCGGKTVRTGYSYPYQQLRCNACYRKKVEKQEQEDKIKSLEERIKILENGINPTN